MRPYQRFRNSLASVNIGRRTPPLATQSTANPTPLHARDGSSASGSLRPVQPQVANRVRAEVDPLPVAAAMPRGQLGNRRQRVGTKPQCIGGPPALGERAAEYGLATVGAQVAVPLAVPAGHASMQIKVWAADELQYLAVVTRPRRPVAGQRASHPRRLGVRLQVHPDVMIEQAQLTNPGGDQAQVRRLGAQPLGLARVGRGDEYVAAGPYLAERPSGLRTGGVRVRLGTQGSSGRCR
jgi:hypothetical protein